MNYKLQELQRHLFISFPADFIPDDTNIQQFLKYAAMQKINRN